MRTIEICAGSGGLAAGGALAGLEHHSLVEWNTAALQTLQENREFFPKAKIFGGDVRDYQFDGRVSVLGGGVPCQPFSVGGLGHADQDQRDLFPEFVRGVRETQTEAFVVENVRGLLRPRFSTYFNYVLLQLQHPELVRKRSESQADHLRRLEEFHTKGKVSGLGYRVLFRLVNAADYGVPQCRQRVFIVGFRNDINQEGWSFPSPTHSKEALVWSKATGIYQERHKLKGLKPKQQPLDFDRPSTLPWVTVRDALEGLPEFGSTEATELNHIRPSAKARKYPGHTGSLLDEPAKTLKAGVHGVPGGENMLVFTNGSMRYMSVREAARLQTFPDAWRIVGPWSEGMRQMGNAVPVRLAHVVMQSVADHLRGWHACRN